MVTAGGTAIAAASDERILQSWDMPCEIGAKVVEAVQSRPVRVMIYVGSKIYINEYSNRRFCRELPRRGLSREQNRRGGYRR